MAQLDENIERIRHSLAHVMAAAIDQLYPGAQFGVGPTVKDGFYYDVYLGEKALPEADLAKIETKMRSLIADDIPFEREQWPLEQAKRFFTEHRQNFKVELLNDLEQHGTTNVREIGARELGVADNDAKVTTVNVYKTGPFIDLCRGPHVASTGELKHVAFKLTRVSGAYWRGDETKTQLQRVYGVAFADKAALEQYEHRIAEAKQRDHRKLGRELDLFVFSDLVGSGLPMYTPRGTVIITELQNALREIGTKHGQQWVSIPHLAKLDIYKVSGHAEKFAGELFNVVSHYNQEFVLKPVNCPHHIQIYGSRPRSYRDLPIRYAEFTMQYRDEKPGELGGLARTRGFIVDDGHTFCTVQQIKEEVRRLVEIIREFYEAIGLWDKHWVSLSVRDVSSPQSYIGEAADWDQAEAMLAGLAQDSGLDAKRMEGEAAIYGPKLDFMFEDALGNDRQLATIQLDFAMPKRFGISYTDSAGKDQTPVLIHRAILGSFERFLTILIEHFAGAFPVWLAPEQVRVVPVSDKVTDYAQTVAAELADNGIRYHLDDSGESLGKRIREAEVLKVPYVLVVGQKEADGRSVSVRHYHDGDLGAQSLDEFMTQLNEAIIERH